MWKSFVFLLDNWIFRYSFNQCQSTGTNVAWGYYLHKRNNAQFCGYSKYSAYRISSFCQRILTYLYGRKFTQGIYVMH